MNGKLRGRAGPAFAFKRPVIGSNPVAVAQFILMVGATEIYLPQTLGFMDVGSPTWVLY